MSHTPLAYVEGLESYVNLGSAWYEVKTYVDGEIKLVTGILIKNEYPEDNIPATGKINPLLRLKKGFTTVALHMDSRAVVHSSNGVPLFSVIPSSDTTFIYGDYAYRWAAMATLILFIICFHASIRTRRSFWIAMAVLTASWIYARVLPWKCNPEIGFFSPLVYADSKLFNSLASLIFTNSFIAISVLAAYMVRRRLLKAYLQLSRKWQKLVGCVALLYTLTLALYIGYTIRSLIINSNVGLDLSMILGLSIYSVLCYISYVTMYLSLLYMIQVTVTTLSGNRKVSMFSWRNMLIYLLLVSLATVGLVTYYSDRKEVESIRVMSDKLSVERDLSLEIQLRTNELKIANDQIIGALAFWPDGGNDIIRNRLLERYLFRNMSQKYGLSVTICSDGNQLIVDRYTPALDCYSFYQDEIVKFGTPLAPGSNFYYMNHYNGQTSYLGVFTYIDYNRMETSRLYIEIESKYVSGEGTDPLNQLQKGNAGGSFRTMYSYAKYTNGRIASYSGDHNFSVKINPDEFKSGYQKRNRGRYVYFVNKYSESDMIVVARVARPLYTYLISYSYLCLFFALFFIVLTGKARRHSVISLPQHTIKRSVTMVMAVTLGVALITLGVGTVYYSLMRGKRLNERRMEANIAVVQNNLSDYCLYAMRYTEVNTPSLGEAMDRIAENLQSDINLYDVNGRLIRSTNPELFEKFVLGSRMNHNAYKTIVIDQSMRCITSEVGAGRKFSSAYAPLFNIDGKLVAIVSIPFITNSSKAQQDSIISVASIINIYLLLIIIGIVVAIMLSDSITRPMTEIKRKMESLSLENSSDMDDKAHSKMAHISYRNRSDEIGMLVAAYNKMVDDLDESTRRLAENEREQAWKEMARQIAHEIKNPLTPMRLSIQHLQRMKNSGAPGWEEKFDDVSRIILSQIDILTEIAGEFSSYSNFYSEDVTREDLVQVLREQITLFDTRESIGLYFCSDEQHAYVNVRKKQIIRAFVNLVSNAVQALEPLPYPGKVILNLAIDGDYYKISVEDNGTGVNPEDRHRLFKPNFTTKSSGTGLGLAITASIITQSGGTISYETSSLGGAAFVIRLPMA
ncbi:MAG: HAMP domain-containing protein [Bacteroidales bacterium]|nr:HAMP domain-containing protein [Bacteroidales bacterium]